MARNARKQERKLEKRERGREKERGSPPLAFLQLETHLLTAAHLIALLSTSKRVLSPSVILSARVLIHFGSCLLSHPGVKRKKTSHRRRLINSGAEAAKQGGRCRGRGVL